MFPIYKLSVWISCILRIAVGPETRHLRINAPAHKKIPFHPSGKTKTKGGQRMVQLTDPCVPTFESKHKVWP